MNLPVCSRRYGVSTTNPITWHHHLGLKRLYWKKNKKKLNNWWHHIMSPMSLLYLEPIRALLWVSWRGPQAPQSSKEFKGRWSWARQWAELVTNRLLFWWEGLLSEQVRGHEEEGGRTVCCLLLMAAKERGQQRPILQCLADQLIFPHINADQWGEEQLRARHIDT